MPSERIREQDYAPNPRTPRRDEEHHYTPDYLGGAGQSHLREQSVDTQYQEQDDTYDLGHHMLREDASPVRQTEGGYSVPVGAETPQPQTFLSPPPPAPTTNQNRVHYPPSPYMAQEQTYTTVPLNDHATSRENLNPNPTGHHVDTNFAPPQGSGRNTPSGSANSKKRWSFLPGTQQPSPSFENGPMNEKAQSGRSTPRRPRGMQRGGSWDLLGNDRAEWEEYNPAQASVENLRFAEGDVGTNKISRLYYWALNRSIVFRWALYIIPVTALLWIPGILGLTAFPEAHIWGTPLMWWSIWFTVVWVGFWASTAAFMMLPSIWRNTVGAIIPTARRYEDVVRNLGRYAKLVAWTLAIWIAFQPLVVYRYQGEAETVSRNNLTTVANILFALFLCSIVYAVEKLVVQLIAFQFHQDSYEDRLKEQKFNLKTLVTLYINSRDIPGRTDTLIDSASGKTKASKAPKIAIRKALRGLKSVAETTTTALGNVASEMAGQSVLQTNSPQNRVTAALNSANKSKALARRIYYSYRQPGVDTITLIDVARYFPDLETAQAGFEVLDKDGNGDATRDEIEASILSIHRERLSLEASMRDLDGAVRRLDDIFLVIVFVIAVLVLAAAITTKITALVTSAGTFILGLAWLIGPTMQEILLACIFLFVKHPYDVGDRVDIDGKEYTVAKMSLLSTNFKRIDGKFVWIGHNILASKVIENVRRSGATAEEFTFEVAFETTFEALQTLRARMLAFCKANARDFQPVFDVIVDDIPAQGKMVLKADIRYKSNWQQGALKVQRRNKWICALKLTLADLKILGPAGAGDPSPPEADPVKYTLVPYEQVVAAQPTASTSTTPASPPPTFAAATTADGLMDRRNVVSDTAQDIWGEADEYNDGGYLSQPATPGIMTPTDLPGHSARHRAARDGSGSPVAETGMRSRQARGAAGGETIEMTSAPVRRPGQI